VTVAGSLIVTVGPKKMQHAAVTVWLVRIRATCGAGTANAEIELTAISAMSAATNSPCRLQVFETDFMTSSLEFLLVTDFQRERGRIVRQLPLLANSARL